MPVADSGRGTGSEASRALGEGSMVEQETVRMGRGGRPRPLVRASRIRRATNAGSRRRSRGEKRSMMIPAAAIRSRRRLVRSQSSGDRCQARESASAATPASCHQASGLPRKTSPNDLRWWRLRSFPGPGCRTGPGDPASHPPRSPVTTSVPHSCRDSDISATFMSLREVPRPGRRHRGTGCPAPGVLPGGT